MTDVRMRRLLETHGRQKVGLREEILRLERYKKKMTSATALRRAAPIKKNSKHHVSPTATAFPTNNVSCEDLAELTAQVLATQEDSCGGTSPAHGAPLPSHNLTNGNWGYSRHKLPQLKPPYCDKRHLQIKSELTVKGSKLATLPQIKQTHTHSRPPDQTPFMIMNNPELTQRCPKAQLPTDTVQQLYEKYELQDRTWADNYEYELMRLQALTKVQDWLHDNPVPVSRS